MEGLPLRRAVLEGSEKVPRRFLEEPLLFRRAAARIAIGQAAAAAAAAAAATAATAEEEEAAWVLRSCSVGCGTFASLEAENTDLL